MGKRKRLTICEMGLVMLMVNVGCSRERAGEMVMMRRF